MKERENSRSSLRRSLYKLPPIVEYSLIDELNNGRPDFDKIKYILVNFPLQAQQIIPTDGSLPMHVACRHSKILEDLSIIECLYKSYPEALMQSNKFGLLPLHKAMTIASENHLRSITFLIENNPSSLTAKTKDGQTPLHITINVPRNPNVNIVMLLIERNPHIVFIPDKYCQLPLHKAASKSHIDAAIIQALISSSPLALTIKDLKGYVNKPHEMHCFFKLLKKFFFC